MIRKPFETADILKAFLSSLLKLQNVERGSIWVKKGARYLCIEALGEESEKVKGISISSDHPSIVGWVIENGRRTIAKAGEDERHFQQIEQDFALKSNLILCFPLILESGEVFGALELIDVKSSGNIMNLDKDYLELIEDIIKVGSIAISKYFDYHKQLEENRELKKIICEYKDHQVIIGQSRCFLNEYEKLKSYARVDYPVLITGESGTGKELFAQELHHLSDRREKPYLVQNCCAIPETLLESELFGHKRGAFTGAVRDKNGLFETANEGTVFLDEIGDMSYDLQARLLRFIQDGEIKPLGSTVSKRVDVRIVAATNANLKEAIAEKRFREDLFYRLNVLPLHLPPLRNRSEDVPLLLESFIHRESKRLGIKPKRLSNEVLDLLVHYPWRGNIRELENFVRHIIVVNDDPIISLDNLPKHFTVAPPPESLDAEPGQRMPGSGRAPDRPRALDDRSWKDLEREYVLQLLEQYRWNISRCARAAGLNRSTFDSRLRKLGIRKHG
ncbi:MAG: sigma 54-interacting transcriptional regulator [bacterium]